MKKLLTIIGVAALLATVSTTVHAQAYPVYAPQSITLPPVVAAANSPTNLASPVVLDLRKQNIANVYFQVSSADASSTTNVTLKGAWSPDGSTAKMDTNNAVTLTANVLAGIKCYTGTNTLTANGKGYFIIYQESIGANSAITNNDAGYLIKIGAP